MKKAMRFMWELIAAGLVTAVIGYVLYRAMPTMWKIAKHEHARSFVRGMRERDIIKNRYKVTHDIVIENDMNETVYVESDDSVVMSKPEETILKIGGHARIFVPKMKGWYTITYPCPYPLAGEHEGIMMFVFVPLSQLIHSINTGSVEAMRTNEREEMSKPLEKVILKV